MSRLAEIAADPEWLPHHLDAANDRVLFVRIDRETRRSRPFLYNFEPTSAGEWCWIEAGEVRERAVEAAPCQFIFHTAFCRSTLLVQALDVEGFATGLSEPAVIQDLADIRGSAFGQAMLGPVLGLLARTSAPGGRVIVKPSNAANPLLPLLLEASPRSRVLLMSSTLPTFLRSVAKKGVAGRAWARRLHRKVEQYAPLTLDLDPYELTDLQAAGLAWLCQQRHFAGLLTADREDRLATLDSDVFNTNRRQTIAALGAFFELALDEGRAQAIAAGPVFATHSKQGGDFAEIAAREEAEAAGPLIEREIEMVAEWILQVAARLDGHAVPASRPLFAP